MNLIEEIKASDKTMLILALSALVGFAIMKVSAGFDTGVYIGLGIALTSAGLAVIHKTKNKKVKADPQQSDIKPIKIS
ncbi:hypothetical protein MSSIH_3467 [Methanosarcina siciliae HI350]|uniref:Uncharacterized protein n=1 Tax=Methanosarcina siciliae HI350 TaxID=1434119 RepID=A0A0E3PHW6_9EURY|nr:hypothetical protein [Methanosarcina siciliae]AKB34157.1 hypothetical protein MSSIH_3467 [Methanosarcina siciliae HI350]